MKLPILLCSALLLSQITHAAYDQYQKHMLITALSAGVAYTIYSSVMERKRLSSRTAQEVLRQAEVFILMHKNVTHNMLITPNIRNYYLMSVRNHIHWINQRIAQEEITVQKAANCLNKLIHLEAQIKAIKPFLIPKIEIYTSKLKTV